MTVFISLHLPTASMTFPQPLSAMVTKHSYPLKRASLMSTTRATSSWAMVMLVTGVLVVAVGRAAELRIESATLTLVLASTWLEEGTKGALETGMGEGFGTRVMVVAEIWRGM